MQKKGNTFLTQKQVLIIDMLSFDFTPQEVAQELGITEDAVYRTIKRAKKIFNVNSNAGLVARAIRRKLI